MVGNRGRRFVRGRRCRMLLNKKAVREYILRTVAEKRPAWDCTQVSPEILGLLDAKLRRTIDRGVWQHSSAGKTFRDLI